MLVCVYIEESIHVIAHSCVRRSV